MLKSKIEKTYEKHKAERICQGDILKGIKFYIIDKTGKQLEVIFPCVIVVSQDCDLENGIPPKKSTFDPSGKEIFNQYLPNVLVLPAFVAEHVKQGIHLEKLVNIKTDPLNSERWSIVKKNNNARYHYLPSDIKLNINDLVIDFKLYYSLPMGYLTQHYKEQYVATVNELFRERLSQRFADYFNRIALPEFKDNTEPVVS